MTTHSRRRRGYRHPSERDDEETVGNRDVGGEEGVSVSLRGFSLGPPTNERNERPSHELSTPVPVPEQNDNELSDPFEQGIQREDNDKTTPLHTPAPPSTATLATTTTPSTNSPSSPNTVDHHASNFPAFRSLSHLYIVAAAHLVRSGLSASIEPPAIREEVIAVCIDGERAREIAWQTWRARGWGFEGGGGEEDAEVWDGVGVENLFRDGRKAFGEGGVGVELMRIVSRGGQRMEGEDEGRVEFEEMHGEKRVAVWRVGLEWEGARGDEEYCARTPVSE